MTGRAKWEAWSKEGRESEMRNESLESIQHRYLTLCGKYGWVPNAKQEGGKGTQGTEEEEEEEEEVHDIDWDAPYDPRTDKHRHGGKAMGNAVSVLEKEDESSLDSTTLHGITILGDVGSLKTLLDLDDGIDINEKDEYVSTWAF